jgi:four helix bundle protein
MQVSAEKQVIRSFRDLAAWQKAIQLSVAVYRLTREFPREELYGLTSQMRRATVSVASNIAEGHGRLGTNEYRQFLGVARGSNFELQTQLEIAKALQLGDPRALDEVERMSHEVGKVIFGILDGIRNRRSRIDP